MHIYYYEKNGYYYVMNENGVLEKYSVSNNIEMILKLENIIHYFTLELNEKNTEFNFKTLEELNLIDQTNISSFIALAALAEYSIFKDYAFNLMSIEVCILNIINEIYDNKKTHIQDGEFLLEEILKELLTTLNEKLDMLKQISNYKKEIVPLSEFDHTTNKIFIDNTEEINEYKDDLDIELDVNWNPENIFIEDNEYDLELQKKIDKVKNMYLEKSPSEVKEKLKSFKNKNLSIKLFILINASYILDTLILNDKEYSIMALLILNVMYSYIYYSKYKKKYKSLGPILKLEKKDK